MLTLKNIRKFYGVYPALYDLSLNIEDGALYGFVGPNGAGKTTAIKIMAGLLRPDSGSVSVDGKPVYPAYREAGALIGYVPDSFGSFRNQRVSEYLEFFASCHGIEGFEARKRIEELLSYVELSGKEELYTEALSRGMQQRLSLARALLADPPILILDEPASGLDPRTRYEFKQILGELSDKGKTIIISSHILSDISELCTDVAILDQGRAVMNGRLMDVMKKVTAGNPLIISLNGGINRAVAFLKNEEKITSIAVKRKDIQVGFTGGTKDEQDLLRRMIREDLPVRSFSRETGSLEAIFMQLTGSGKEKLRIDSDGSGEE